METGTLAGRGPATAPVGGGGPGRRADRGSGPHAARAGGGVSAAGGPREGPAGPDVRDSTNGNERKRT